MQLDIYLSDKWEYVLVYHLFRLLLYLFLYFTIAVITKQGCKEGCEQWGWMCYHSNKLTHWQDCTISLSRRVSAADVANELWSFPAFVVVGRGDTPVREEICDSILRLGRKNDHILPCTLYNPPSTPPLFYVFWFLYEPFWVQLWHNVLFLFGVCLHFKFEWESKIWSCPNRRKYCLQLNIYFHSVVIANVTLVVCALCEKPVTKKLKYTSDVTKTGPQSRESH